MKTIDILEDTDVVFLTDWCRPLQIVSMNGGHSDYYSFESCYSGSPENNAKWVRVYQVFGSVWFNKQVKDFPKEPLYEFIRGDIPKHHTYGKTKAEKRFEYKHEYLLQSMHIGRYRGLLLKTIFTNYPDYFKWACDKGIILSENQYIEKS